MSVSYRYLFHKILVCPSLLHFPALCPCHYCWVFPPPPDTLFRGSCSQRQTAHPSITTAASLWCWALSCTTQLLSSIKTCSRARMHMHTITKTHMDTCRESPLHAIMWIDTAADSQKTHLSVRASQITYALINQEIFFHRLFSALSPLTGSQKTNLFSLSSDSSSFVLFQDLEPSLLFILRFFFHPTASFFFPLSLCVHRRLMRTPHKLADLPSYCCSAENSTESDTDSQSLHQYRR